MSYNKKIWVPNETLLSAENFNHMEEGIDAAHKLIDNTSNEVTDIKSTLETTRTELEETKNNVENIIKSLENIKPAVGPLDNYLTRDETLQAIQTAIANIGVAEGGAY